MDYHDGYLSGLRCIIFAVVRSCGELDIQAWADQDATFAGLHDTQANHSCLTQSAHHRSSPESAIDMSIVPTTRTNRGQTMCEMDILDILQYRGHEVFPGYR
jgi:hypothetical protein